MSRFGAARLLLGEIDVDGGASPFGVSTRTVSRLTVSGTAAAKNQSPCHSLPLPPVAALRGV